MLPQAPHREDIKAEIKKRGKTLSDLWRKNKPLAYSALSLSLDRPIPRANRIIAEFLGLPLNHLWPQWYDSSGKRISSRSISKHSAKRPQPHSKKTRRNLTKKSGAA